MSLIDAIESGDVGEVRRLLQGGADPSCRTERGSPALAVAAHADSLPIVEALLVHGADVAATDRSGGTALHAGPFGIELLSRLIDAGVPIDARDTEGYTALFLWADDPEAVRLLLEAGADPNLATSTMETPLTFCATCGHAASAELLLDHGANPNYIDDIRGWSVLLAAAETGEPDMVEILLDRGADPDYRSPTGDVALGLALELEHIDAAILLAERSSEATRRSAAAQVATLHDKLQRLIRSVTR